MQDQPDSARLLGAMADTLEKRVLNELSGSAQHQVRVVISLCRILEREQQLDAGLDAAANASLIDLLGHPDESVPTTELWAELAERIEHLDHGDPSGADDFARRAHTVVAEIVRGKVAVAKPGYDHGTQMNPDDPT